ncbi:hypothetical protein [Vogesella sp. LIG4]|uniref:hypothetical protein n=1 Tax=Vogesella sp. LIG4 TaxID=1192162 RepID=UPI00081F973F|nr:hypothetical protein [Vogesella sp. LIG4]SCK14772.1 hypothetical protein PSELUDRAFT_1445 [Vogesella sp. LIG4]
MKKIPLLFACCLSLLAAQAFAGVIPTVPATETGDSHTQTRAYAGLKWTLGEGPTPSLVLGLVNARTTSGGHSDGADLVLSFGLTGGIKPQALKLSYLNGSNEVQGELGLGYSFVAGKPFGGLGLRGPYATLAGDYLDSKILPSLTLHSLGKFDKPQPHYSCPSSLYTLSGTTCIGP